ncbi:putative DNA alkylation repair enzyme [Acidobacteriia bacterium SbA2]|nr:putative DNA alkylation repair enzyme [Acidobacteriia bacterium SbA2]
MTFNQVLKTLESKADPAAVLGMARFGITAAKAFGWSAPALKKLAREIGKDHALAERLWSTGTLEARFLAGLVAERQRVTERLMEDWVKDFDSWAVCDGTCLNLFRYTPFAYQKCREWSGRREEFVKRAAFALMACLAVSDKEAPDQTFLRLLPLIKREACDERNYVRKAVNWALRQIGKRNRRLNRAAIEVAQQIHDLDSPAARWIASDALRELRSPAVERRVNLTSRTQGRNIVS